MNRLYHVPLSPFCRKVRLTLAEKKIEVELVEERYWEPSPDFLRRNPAGKVPILIDGDMTIWESLAILEHLAERFPKAQLWPDAPAARASRRVTRRRRGPAEHRRSQPSARGHPLAVAVGRGRRPRGRRSSGRVLPSWLPAARGPSASAVVLFAEVAPPA